VLNVQTGYHPPRAFIGCEDAVALRNIRHHAYAIEDLQSSDESHRGIIDPKQKLPIPSHSADAAFRIPLHRTAFFFSRGSNRIDYSAKSCAVLGISSGSVLVP
jgi:hypothetical protein